jgi:hypothetical protein
MNNDQLEQALRRYQPRRPDPALRDRVLAAAGRSQVPLRAIDWGLLAAAASLAIAMLWPHQGTDARDPVAAAYRDRIEDVATALGGGSHAHQLALIVVGAGASDIREDEW